MDQAHSVEIVDDITIVRFCRKPGEEEIRAAIDDAAGQDRTGLRLWDFSSEGMNLSREQLALVADYARERFPRTVRVAIVANEDLTIGLSRVYTVFRDQGRDDTRVFRTERIARQWLAG